MRNSVFAITVLLIFFLGSCCKEEVLKDRFEKLIAKKESNYEFTANELFPGKWEQIFIIRGIACEEKIREITGLDFHSKRCVQDNEMMLVYAEENLIVNTEIICLTPPYIEFELNVIRSGENKKYRIKKGKNSFIVSSFE